MKKFVFLCVFFAFSLSLRAQESGIRFFHGTWDEAIALAKKEKKKIFVDFYTEWCGPCPEYVVDRVRASASGGGI